MPVPSDDTHPCSPCPPGTVGDITAAPGGASWAIAWGLRARGPPG